MLRASKSGVALGSSPAIGASTGTCTSPSRGCLICSMGASSAARVADGGIHDDRDDDQHADETIEIIGRGAQKEEHVLDRVNERRAEHHAEDRAAPARESSPADHAG